MRAVADQTADVDRQLANLANATGETGFTDTLQKKHDNLAERREQMTEKLGALTTNGMNAERLALDLRMKKGLARMRKNLTKLSYTYSSGHATAEQRFRLKTALSEFLGELPLRPDYENSALIATLASTKEALTLLATGSAPDFRAAYRNGSGGRI